MTSKQGTESDKKYRSPVSNNVSLNEDRARYLRLHLWGRFKSIVNIPPEELGASGPPSVSRATYSTHTVERGGMYILNQGLPLSGGSRLAGGDPWSW